MPPERDLCAANDPRENRFDGATAVNSKKTNQNSTFRSWSVDCIEREALQPMLSRAAELVNGQAEPLKGGVLKSGTELLEDRASELLTRRAELLRKRAFVLLKICEKKFVTDWGNAIVNATFGLLMGGLVVLLILIHAGVPIVGY